MQKENHFDITAAGDDRLDEAGPVVLVSTIAPQIGRTIELLYGEVAAMYRCAEPDSGLLSTRLYRSLCGEGVMLIQTFDSMRHYREWSDSSDGRIAMERLRGIAERVNQSFYRLFYRD